APPARHNAPATYLRYQASARQTRAHSVPSGAPNGDRSGWAAGSCCGVSIDRIDGEGSLVSTTPVNHPNASLRGTPDPACSVQVTPGGSSPLSSSSPGTRQACSRYRPEKRSSPAETAVPRSEEHTSDLQSRFDLV